jgi:hypothetical protein
MRAFVFIVLVLLSPAVCASRPIMQDEALACVNGGTPSKTGELHTISFSNGYEMDVLRPNSLAYMVVLKSSGTYSATFKVDGLATQTIDFSFNGFPENNVCFSYDKSKEIWSMSRTSRDACYACSLMSRDI